MTTTGVSGNIRLVFTMIYLYVSPTMSLVISDRHNIVSLGATFELVCIHEDAYSSLLDWKYNNSIIVKCKEKPFPGEVCTHYEDGGKRLLLRFEGVEKTSSGTYTCDEYYHGINRLRDNIRDSTNVSVTVKVDSTTTPPEVTTDTPETTTDTPETTTDTPETTTDTPETAMRANDAALSTSITSEGSTQSTSTATVTASVIRGYVAAAENSVVVVSVVISLAVVFAVICGVFAYIWKRRLERLGPSQSDPETPVGQTVPGAKYKQWEFCREHIQLLNKLGDGFFGTVWKAQAYGINYVDVWTTVAVKIGKIDDHITTEGAPTTNRPSLCEEAKLLTDLGHCDNENVVRLLGLCHKGGPMWLIFEHAIHGNLRHYLRSKRDPVGDRQPTVDDSNLKPMTNNEDGGITPWKMFNFALQIANGMKYLISRKILHCDLAARNVLVFDDELLKICDFGMAKDVRYVDYYRREMPGVVPAKWMSPEAMLDKLHTEFSDVWSFGILMWEISTLGGSPYPGIPVEKLYDLIIKGYRMSCPVNCPRSLYQEMKLCWAAQRTERPAFETLAGHISYRMTEIKGPPMSEVAESANGKESSF